MTTPTTPTGTGATPPACPECAAGEFRTSEGFHQVADKRWKPCPDFTPASAGEGAMRCNYCKKMHRPDEACPHPWNLQPPALSQGGGEPAHPSGESDRRMLLVWQQWAEKVAGNQGAADLFGRVA